CRHESTAPVTAGAIVITMRGADRRLSTTIAWRNMHPCCRVHQRFMSIPILATKLYSPPPPLKAVPRPGLVERLNEGLHRKLTLISAPAGFGKTTLVSAWVAGSDRQVAWLSLDEGDNVPTRFLA